MTSGRDQGPRPHVSGPAPAPRAGARKTLPAGKRVRSRARPAAHPTPRRKRRPVPRRPRGDRWKPGQALGKAPSARRPGHGPVPSSGGEPAVNRPGDGPAGAADRSGTGLQRPTLQRTVSGGGRCSAAPVSRGAAARPDQEPAGPGLQRNQDTPSAAGRAIAAGETGPRLAHRAAPKVAGIGQGSPGPPGVPVTFWTTRRWTGSAYDSRGGDWAEHAPSIGSLAASGNGMEPRQRPGPPAPSKPRGRRSHSGFRHRERPRPWTGRSPRQQNSTVRGTG